mgnify:CR=1 FL=1
MPELSLALICTIKQEVVEQLLTYADFQNRCKQYYWWPLPSHSISESITALSQYILSNVRTVDKMQHCINLLGEIVFMFVVETKCMILYIIMTQLFPAIIWITYKINKTKNSLTDLLYIYIYINTSGNILKTRQIGFR